MLNEAESILARSRGIHDILHQSDEEPRGRVTIGALPTLARHYLVDHLADLIREYPNVQWSIRIGVGNLIEELHSGEIDVLYFIGHLDVHGLEVHEIEPISMVYAISPELWPGENPPSIKDLSDHLLMLWRGDDPIFTLIENHARAQGLVSPNTPTVPDIDTLKKLAVRGVGYTILPDYVLEDEIASGALSTYTIEGLELDLPIREYVVSDRYQGAAQRLFAERVRGGVHSE